MKDEGILDAFPEGLTKNEFSKEELELRYENIKHNTPRLKDLILTFFYQIFVSYIYMLISSIVVHFTIDFILLDTLYCQ